MQKCERCDQKIGLGSGGDINRASIQITGVDWKVSKQHIIYLSCPSCMKEFEKVLDTFWTKVKQGKPSVFDIIKETSKRLQCGPLQEGDDD